MNYFNLTKEQIMGVVRHVCTTLGGYGVAQGLVTDQDVVTLSGAAVIVVGVVMSLLNKKKVATVVANS